MDGFRVWLCRGDVSPEDAFVLFPGLVSFEKKLGAIFPSLSLPLFVSLCLAEKRKTTGYRVKLFLSSRGFCRGGGREAAGAKLVRSSRRIVGADSESGVAGGKRGYPILVVELFVYVVVNCRVWW